MVSGRYLKGVWKVSEECMQGIKVVSDSKKMVFEGSFNVNFKACQAGKGQVRTGQSGQDKSRQF